MNENFQNDFALTLSDARTPLPTFLCTFGSAEPFEKGC